MSALSQLYGASNATITSVGAPTFLSGNPGLAVTSINPFLDKITLTFDKQVVKGSAGNITIRQDSAAGTGIATFSIPSSPYVLISGADVTIDLRSADVNFPPNKDIYVVFDANSLKDGLGLTGISSLTTYYFRTDPTKQLLYSFGSNASGVLGFINYTGNVSDPSQTSFIPWKKISTFGHTLATKTDGTLWAWGDGTNAQLGQGVNLRISRSSPVQIPGTTWSSISCGGDHSLATKTDGTLWGWGGNTSGQLGQGTGQAAILSPIQIPGTTWSSIDCGDVRLSLATKTDGTLWSWGYNRFGQLGQNTTTYRSSPVQIPGTTWSSISAGNYHTLATKTDGTLWAWGYNVSGRLGQNNGTEYSSPVQIPGTTWSSISGGTSHSLATKTDGTLWGWGANQSGQLGQNSSISYSSPIQIPGTTWSSIRGGNTHSLASKTDGTLWGWGNNYNGELGQNSRVSQSSPVQIPGTTWNLSDVSSIGSNSLVFKTFT